MEESLSQIPATNVLFLPREVSNHQAGAEGLRRTIVCFRMALALSIMVNTLLFGMGGAMCAFLLAFSVV